MAAEVNFENWFNNDHLEIDDGLGGSDVSSSASSFSSESNGFVGERNYRNVVYESDGHGSCEESNKGTDRYLQQYYSRPSQAWSQMSSVEIQREKSSENTQTTQTTKSQPLPMPKRMRVGCRTRPIPGKSVVSRPRTYDERNMEWMQRGFNDNVDDSQRTV